MWLVSVATLRNRQKVGAPASKIFILVSSLPVTRNVLPAKSKFLTVLISSEWIGLLRTFVPKSEDTGKLE